MNKKKRKAVILLILFLLGSTGCNNADRAETSVSLNTFKPPLSVVNDARLPRSSMPSIVVNDSLLDLGVEEFKREYANIPDDYKIEIGLYNADFTHTFEIEPEVWVIIDKTSGTIAKSQAEQIQYIHMVDEDSFNMSLKELRYFPNIKKISLMEAKLQDISEMGYLTILEEINNLDCDLGIGNSTEELQCLTVMKKIYINIFGCQLKNLDFPKHFSDLNGSTLCFGGNQITNISVLSTIEYADTITLPDNLIKDIGPLSSLKKVRELDLLNNKIFDLSPLENIKKADKIWLGNNRINDFSMLSKLKKMKRLKKYHVK